ncbi:MAG: hypothetical protein LQ350_007200 [Teloschistes chrysophthalmus]|nr:MAG: hypothetical protein LQ350_007200 [Niorma chrysophthalma]
MKIDVRYLSVLALGRLALAAVNPTASGQIVDEVYLTQDTFTQTYTQTVDSKPTPETTAVQIAVATATAAADGYEVGDVSVVFSKELVDKLKGLATTACGGPTKIKKRQSCSLSGAGSFVEAAAGPGGPMNDLLLNGFPKITIAAGDVARAIQAMVNAGKVAASAAPVAYLASLWLAVYVEEGAKQIVRIPKADVDHSQPDPSPTSSSSPCPTGANAPLCADQENCKGILHICIAEKYKTCLCIDQFDIDGHDVDSGQLKAQQALLASVAALPAPAVTGSAWCVWNANQDATPSAWCECDNAKSTFSIVTATGDAACPYTTPPGDTISVVTKNGNPSSTAAPSPPGPTFSSTPPVCNAGDRFASGDVGKMRDGVDAFCKGITDDKIDKAFNPSPVCSVKLSDGVWMELFVSASFLDLNGKCTMDNMAHLSTGEEKCNYGMTNAILCANGQTTHAGNPNSSGGYDTVECVLYQVNPVTSTNAPAC